MIEIYETLDNLNEEGKYYNVYSVPSSLPVSSPFTRLKPDPTLINPRFDWLKENGLVMKLAFLINALQT